MNSIPGTEGDFLVRLLIPANMASVSGPKVADTIHP